MKIIQKCFMIFIFLPLSVCAQQMTDYTGHVFPSNHVLNVPIDSLPVHPNSQNIINTIGANTAIHPDFGTDYDGYPMGIHYNIVGAGQSMVNLTFEYESDPGPYPMPIPPYVEGLNTYTEDRDGDRHILVIDSSTNLLYETWYTWPAGHAMPDPTDWSTFPPSNLSYWWAGSGAIFDLTSNILRPDGWTSGDAAGLPIFPLLIRYDEVQRALVSDGVIHHAIRFTVQSSRREYIWPARHYASSSTDPNRASMGLRFRLKDSVNISGFSPRIQVILRTMKKYGIIVADNGGNWFFQGTHDDRWDDDEISTLKDLHGHDFEAVDISSWMERPGFDPNSAAVPPVSAASVSSENNTLGPQAITIHQNYPNPFNPSTTISFSVGTKNFVSLRVFDILGREITTLLNEAKTAGTHTVQWDGKNSTGQKVGSGVYFYQLRSKSGFTNTKKMILIN